MLRFKKDDGTDYPEWEEKRFDEVFNKITDYVAAGSFADIAKNVSYINTPNHAQLVRTVDVKKNFKNKDFVYVDENAYNYLWRVNLDNEKHIILPNIGANIGEFYLLCPENLPYKNNVLGPNAILLGTSQKIEFWNAYFGTRSFQKKLSLIVAASGQPKFNKTELKGIKVPLPCLEEQQKIADFLSSVDEVITCTEKELENLELQKKSVVQKIFSQKVRFKDDNGDEYPEWGEKKILDMLCQNVTDGPHESPDILDEGIPFISVDAIVNNKIDFSRKRGYISSEYNEQCNKKYKPQKYDVYLVKSGSTVGKVAYVDTDIEFNIWSPLAAMRVNEQNNYLFLYYLLQTNDIQKAIRIKSFGGTQPNLSMRELEQIKISLPCLEEQQKIADFLSNFDSAIDLTRQELEQWKLIKKGLLQQMFK